jgi:hypothetical protein
MAHFIYPNANLYTNLPVGGDRTGGTNDFAASANVTNESRLTDLSISTSASIPQFDAVQFDMGGTITGVDAVAVYSNAANSNDVHFFNSSSAASGAFGSGDANFITGTSYADLTLGWNVKTGLSNTSGGSAATQRYFYLYSNVATQSTITEVIIGNKLDLTNVNLSGNEGVEYGNDALESYGGVRFSNQRHGARKFFDFNLSFVNETYKTSLETMRDSVKGSHYNLLYYDGSTYHYVKLSDKSLVFKEVAFGVYNTKIELTEQISS